MPQAGLGTIPVLLLTHGNNFELGYKLRPRERLLGLGLIMATSVIILVEGTFCASLNKLRPLPYHAVFDFCFFQAVHCHACM